MGTVESYAHPYSAKFGCPSHPGRSVGSSSWYLSWPVAVRVNITAVAIHLAHLWMWYLFPSRPWLVERNKPDAEQSRNNLVWLAFVLVLLSLTMPRKQWLNVRTRSWQWMPSTGRCECIFRLESICRLPPYLVVIIVFPCSSWLAILDRPVFSMNRHGNEVWKCGFHVTLWWICMFIKSNSRFEASWYYHTEWLLLKWHTEKRNGTECMRFEALLERVMEWQPGREERREDSMDGFTIHVSDRSAVANFVAALYLVLFLTF